MTDKRNLTPKEKLERRRSNVRVWVTHLAAFYVFGGSAALIWLALQANSLEVGPISLVTIDEKKLALMKEAIASAKEMAALRKEMFEHARDVFMLVLPVATGIITYWFASRKQPEESASPESDSSGGTQTRTLPAAGASAAALADPAGSAERGEQQVGDPQGNEQGQGGQRVVERAAVDQVSHGSQPPDTGAEAPEREAR